jgi:chaperonin cofactor prefoldin
MENARTNEVLSEQIAVIQELAQKLSTADLRQLETDLSEMENALNNLKGFLQYLPK